MIATPIADALLDEADRERTDARLLVIVGAEIAVDDRPADRAAVEAEAHSLAYAGELTEWAKWSGVAS